MSLVIEALGEIVISVLLRNVAGLLKEIVDLVLHAKKDLKNLHGKVDRLQNALKDADRKPFFSNERDRDLEGEMKDVLYDAPDIMEEYQTIIELRNSITSRNKVRKPWITLFPGFKEPMSASYQLGNGIKNINQRLDKIERKREKVEKTPKESGEGRTGGEDDDLRETNHHMGAQQPIGRDHDKTVIVEKLLSNDSTPSSMTEKHNVSIISIVGEGGIGKSTLAKVVFNEVEQQFGERRWWVCVSERPKRKDLLQKIMKEVCKGSKAGFEGITNLNHLYTQIQSVLSMKRFLLVLDDVWELDWWEGDVGSTLMNGATGSKILLTSRNIDVCKGIGALYVHRLPILPVNESWTLFLNKASVTKNDLVSHHLLDIAEKIVKKCGGLPLVVQTVGSLMRTKPKDKAKWEEVAKSEIWEWKLSSSSQYGGILPGLLLSYDDLPPYLKSCFIYCSIFPKDYEIEKEGLIMQWMAHGLIEEKKDIDVEVTANQYIDDLINRCLIEETPRPKLHGNLYRDSLSPRPKLRGILYRDHKGSCLRLHDILHDLASYIGGKEYGHASATDRTRHLSLLAVDSAEATKHYASAATNKLRTIMLSGSYSDSPSVNIEHSTKFKWLRVLSLMRCQIDMLPDSIGCLLLLKYLDLSYSNVSWLPSSMGKLYNLQTLDLSCSKIEELPKEMSELCNLRYLGLESTWSLDFIAEGLGKLTSLRTLHRFLVCDDKGKTSGSNIEELKDLNNLKGELSIEGLGGTRKAIDHAGKAKLLKEKHGINSLELDFEEQNASKAVDASKPSTYMLEALEPPHGLESLVIYHYKGEIPSWHLKGNYTMLRTLKLESCSIWKKVTRITSLETLEVKECPALCEIEGMPVLKSLKILSCDGLNTIGHGMPDLESLDIKDCGSLQQLPHHLPTLKLLKVC
ncbi:putative disease resistance protein RGA3 [Nymphaea colorata]|nr:putative disease resistance protein RGA3 [Nymphaea colorata]